MTSWDVVERFSTGKTRAGNDDVIVCSGLWFGVVDGATDKSGLTYPLGGVETAAGAFAAAVVAREISRLPAGVAPLAGVRRVSEALRNAVEAAQPGIGAHERPYASLIVLDASCDQLWWCGDAQAAWVLRNGQVHVRRPVNRVDQIAADFRAAVLAARDAAGVHGDGRDEGRAAALELLRYAPALANGTHPEFAHGVVDGAPPPPWAVGSACLSDADEVVLASDGYPEIVFGEGVGQLGDAEALLAKRLTADPDCVGVLRSTKGLNPGADSFDDRTWLRLRRR